MAFERPASLLYPIEEGQPSSGTAASRDYGSYWGDSNVVKDWANSVDTYSHNEALAAYEREAAGAAASFARESDFNAKEAQKTRDWEKMMSDTAFQRKVADYVKAGFSPLAALEGAAGASTPSASSATASAKNPNATPGGKGSNNFGGLIGSLIASFALIMTKGISAGVQMRAASAADAAKIADNEAKMLYGFEKQRMDLHNKKEFEVFKKRLYSRR